MQRRYSLLALAGLAAATIAPAPVQAQRSFNARPTTPYECAPLVASRGENGVWGGVFHGRRELDSGIFRYDTTFERRCFVSETDCRNWLYNMQSRNQDRVWRAECGRGQPT